MNRNKKIFRIICILLITISALCSNISYADTTNTLDISSSNENITLYSESSILLDSTTGQILYEHNSKEKMYPASTTKLMTAILTLENCNLTDQVTVDKKALNGIPSRIYHSRITTR